VVVRPVVPTVCVGALCGGSELCCCVATTVAEELVWLVVVGGATGAVVVATAVVLGDVELLELELVRANEWCRRRRWAWRRVCRGALRAGGGWTETVAGGGSELAGEAEEPGPVASATITTITAPAARVLRKTRY
jgi:hypothetical protein